jgi:type IV pilus assembly protein PilW
MNMRPSTLSLPARQKGMGLVEIMIGVLIGMIGIVVIFQVLQLSEERKRTTGAGSDAQISGSIAMYHLDRDLRLAGYGFNASRLRDCEVQAFDTNRPGGIIPPPFPLAPVVIVDGPGGAPDTIAVLWGNSSLFVDKGEFSSTTGTSKRTKSGRTGFQKGELVIVTNEPVVPEACALVEITENNDPDGATINHAANVAYVNYQLQPATARYNPPAGFPPAGSPITSGRLYNLGLIPRRNVWQIRSGKLTYSDELHWADVSPADGANDWAEAAEGIVNLQAQYGYDANNNNLIESGEWVDALPLPPLRDWTRVRAIRVALLARSQQFEKTPATTTPPSWAPGAFIMTNADGTPDGAAGDANDWRHYRYHVYQVVIPLRNMIWGALLP